MNTITSCPASAVHANQLNAIMTDYLALERAQTFRRLLVTRCTLIAVAIAIAGAGFGVLPALPCWLSVGVFLLAPALAWIAERRLERRLARRIEDVSGDVRHVVQLPSA